MDERFHFDGLVLDTRSGTVSRDGAEIAVQPLGFTLLQHLVRHPGVLFTRDELLAELWPGVHVTDESLSKAVSRLRSALGNAELIQTVPRRGYRLNASVHTQAAPDGAPVASGVPTFADSMLGRADVLAALQAQLAQGDRLITVKGPGGAGKTRLAATVARECQARGQAAVFVDLAACTTRDEVVYAVAAALALPRDAGDPARRVGLSLRERGPVLVILDNFERIVRHGAGTVGVWLGIAPEAAFLVTTRIVLGLRGERVLELEPLDARDAAALFADRSGLALDTPGLPELAAALDGLPLAIELAAARSRVLSPERLLARLADRFAVLRANHGDRPHRHSSLETALDASWELLDAEQGSALGALSVAPRGVDEAAAAAITGGAHPLDLLQTLVDHSLMRAEPANGWFTIPEAVRQYALRAVGPDAAAQARDRLDRWLAAFGDPSVLLSVDHGDPDGWGARMRPWAAELLAAAERALEAGATERAEATALAAWVPLRSSGPHDRIAEVLRRVAALPDLVRIYSVLHSAGQALNLAQRPAEAEALDRRLLQHALTEGIPRQEATARLNLALALRSSGLASEARDEAALALDAARRADALHHLGTAHLLIANLDRHAGAIESFLEHTQAGIEALEAFGDPRLQTLIDANRAHALAAQGDPLGAIEGLLTVAEDARAAGDRYRQAEMLELTAPLQVQAGDFPSAMDVLERAAALRRALGTLALEARDLLELARIATIAGETARAQQATERATELRTSLGLTP